jgi:predicted PurR-regulated permease PerM
MSIFNYKQRNNIILVSIIALGCFLVFALSGLFSAILGAIVLFTISRPMYLNLVETRKLNKNVVAIMIILLSLVIIVIPFLLLSFMLIGKISELKNSNFPIQEWLTKIDKFAGANFSQPHIAETTLAKLGDVVTVLFSSLLSSAANIIVTLLVLYFLLFFMLTEIREFEAGILKYAPFREQHALKFANALRDSTYSNVIGQGIISVTEGALLAIGFWIFGISDAVFWGVIGAFISFLPVVGAPTLAIPASILLFANGHTLNGVLLLVYGLIFIANVDNFLRMFINKRIANTHPIISVIGVFIGLPLFGILGLVFGPLLLSYFLLLLEIYETNRLAADRLERMRMGNEE